MKKLRIVYNYKYRIWELFHQDVNERIAYDKSIYDLIVTADIIAKLIKPSQVVFIPQNLLSEILINEYV
ncbi:MAG: hypothetical protein K0Q49_1057 [Haloplasmataceae bacterium]|jgi:hypothetical protein|nr:hypothetical protein [Haloplasmataceae bacterium]